MTTGLDEIKSLEDPRITIEVSLYGERAQGYGGPRREFLATIIKEIYAKYFEKGWREHLANDYEVVGLIISLSILQDGLLLRFLEDDMLKVTFKDHPAANECITQFRRGVQKLGLMTIIDNFQQFLFWCSNQTVTF